MRRSVPRRLGAFLLAVTLPGGAVLAQTLGELAEDAKKKRKKATKVYTDEDLRQRAPGASPAPGTPTSRGSGSAPGESGGGSGREGGGGEGGGNEGGEEAEGRQAGGDRGDEAYWRSQLESRLAAIRAAEQRIEAIQSRLNALNSDLLPGGAADPFREQTLEAERVKARQELAEAKLQLERAEDAFQELEEEARRKGVPPAWVREP